MFVLTYLSNYALSIIYNSNTQTPSSYKIDEYSYNIIEKSFREIWPHTFDALEDIRWRLPKMIEKGIGSAYKNTKTMEQSIENRENLLCFRSQQIVKITSFSHLERLNRKY